MQSQPGKCFIMTRILAHTYSFAVQSIVTLHRTGSTISRAIMEEGGRERMGAMGVDRGELLTGDAPFQISDGCLDLGAIAGIRRQCQILPKISNRPQQVTLIRECHASGSIGCS